MVQSRHDDARVVSQIKRGWHVLRADGTWGLVMSVTHDHGDVLLSFEDRPPEVVERFERNTYALTRNVEEQMRFAMDDRARRQFDIIAAHRGRRGRNAMINGVNESMGASGP